MGVGKSMSGGAMGGQSGHVTPMITDNPVFKFKVVDVDRRMEQTSGNGKEPVETLKIGEPIQGKKVGDRKAHRGRIQNIEKDSEGDLLYVIITNEEGENIKIDPTSIQKLNLNDGTLKNESENRKVLLYEQWIIDQ